MSSQAAIPSTISLTGPSALQQAIEPHSSVRALRIARQYKVLCAGPPRGQNLGHWFKKWEILYAEAKATKHSDIATGLIINHFINSLKHTDPHLAGAAFYDLQRRRFMNEQIPTFMEVLDGFRQIFALQCQRPGSSSTPEKSTRQTGNTPPEECVCGKMHWFSNCFYINKSRRPKGWNPNPNVVKKIDETLKDPKVKGNVDKARKKIPAGRHQHPL